MIPADDAPVQTTLGVVAAAMPGHAIRQFEGASRYVIRGQPFRLRWDCTSAASIAIDQGIGDVAARTLNGIGYVDVSAQGDTTWTLTSTPASGPSLQAQASVRVFPTKAEWRIAAFSPADLADPAKEASVWGDQADPDGDGLVNAAEYAAQTPPLSGTRADVLRSGIATTVVSLTSQQHPIHVLRELLPGSGYAYEAQRSDNLNEWVAMPWSDLVEIAREVGGPGQTDRVTYRIPESIAEAAATHQRQFYRVVLQALTQ